MIDAEELFEDVIDTVNPMRQFVRARAPFVPHSPSIRPNYRPLEWADEDEAYPFVVDEWASIGLPSISPRIMSRHFLITGETGSGKTVSAVKPLLKSALTYRSGEVAHRASMLVIDPKHELHDPVSEQCTILDRPVLMLGEADAPRISLFEGLQGRSPSQCVSYALNLCSPAFVAAQSSTDSYWRDCAQQIITTIVAAKKATLDFCEIDLWDGLKMNATRSDLQRALAEMPICSDSKNFFAADLAFCQLLISHPRMLEPFASVCREVGMEPREYAKLTSLLSAPEGQRGSELSSAILYLTELADATLNRCVDLTPSWSMSECSDFVDDAVENGVVMVFTPDLGSQGAEIAGRILKTKYFEAAFRRSNKERPLFYICDEFQRFITADPESGEQAFLDRCRAYRVSCVLATQSLAAIKNRLSQNGTNRSGDVDSTLNILLGNTGSKLFFRSTERDTLDAVRRLMPQARANRPSAVDVRPPSRLRVGECYFVFADGRAGRGRVAAGFAPNDTTSEPTAVVRLLGRMTMPAVLMTQDSMLDALFVQFARKVTIEVDGHGGEPGAFRYLLGILGHLRDREVSIDTIGLANVSGGSALLLSLGDVGGRIAHPNCQLHFRSTTEDPRLERNQIDHNPVGFFDAFAASITWGTVLADHLFGQDGYSGGHVVVDFDDPLLGSIDLGYSGSKTFDVESYPNLYRRLTALDRPISAFQAIRLGLLDGVC